MENGLNTNFSKNVSYTIEQTTEFSTNEIKQTVDKYQNFNDIEITGSKPLEQISILIKRIWIQIWRDKVSLCIPFRINRFSINCKFLSNRFENTNTDFYFYLTCAFE